MNHGIANAQSASVEFAALTDLGCRRLNNEDSYGCDPVQQLYVVCDGMGGMAAGEVASAMAVRNIFQALLVEAHADPTMPLEERLYNAILEVNGQVWRCAASDQAMQGMGTTLVCACVEGNRVVIANVGDSRAYFARDGNCVQITHDHSLIAEQLRLGIINAEPEEASTLQSIVTRAIGAGDSVEPDLFVAELQAGDTIVLATDGLTRYLTIDEIGAGLRHIRNLDEICTAMIGLAKERGGEDNITCLVLKICDPLAPQ
jgi:serine/threonine protein phosphatase PrpC